MSDEVASSTTLVTIYALTDPDTGEVRYVGRTKDPWQRYGNHLALMEGSGAKRTWFLDLQQRQQMPVLKILEDAVTPENASARERWWIEHYHRQGAVLANACMIPKPSKTDQNVISLQPILRRRSILAPSELRRRIVDDHGQPLLSRAQAHNLWSGKAGVGKETMRLLHDHLGISYDELMEIDPVPSPRTRQADQQNTGQRARANPRKRPPGKGDRP